MQNKFIADDNVSLFESLVLGNTLVDELSPNNISKKRQTKKIVEAVQLSSKPKSASGQIVNSWEGLENAKSVADVKKFVEDNLADGSYKQQVLMNLTLLIILIKSGAILESYSVAMLLYMID